MVGRPKSNSASEKELDKVEKQFEAFDKNVKEMTLDQMNMAPKQDVEPQTKLSQKDIEKSKEIYLKPKRSISCKDKFNEAYREEYNFQKQYVQFIAENNELIGSSIEIWTRPFAGLPAEEWVVPTNKPIWGPRYLAEQIKKACYHRLRMDEGKMTGTEGNMTYYGQMISDTIVQRLDARPVSNNKSIFMGAS